MRRALLSISLIVCLAVQLMVGQSPVPWTAIVSGGPATMVGDIHVVTTMIVGNRGIVETQAENSASITFAKNILTLLGKSKMRVQEHAAELLAGGVIVTSTTKYEVGFGCLTVVPIGERARYSVVPYEQRIYVHPEQGDVLITRIKPIARQVRVPQGKTLAVTNACKPGERMDFAGVNEKWYKAAMVAAGTAGVAAVCSLPTGKKPDMSAEKRTCW